METIGTSRLSAYFDREKAVRVASNSKIRAGDGHPVKSYFDLARKIAELQFLNRDYVLLFRGQRTDHKTSKGNSSMRPPLLRGSGAVVPSRDILRQRFERGGPSDSLSRGRFQGNRPTKARENPALVNPATLRMLQNTVARCHSLTKGGSLVRGRRFYRRRLHLCLGCARDKRRNNCERGKWTADRQTSERVPTCRAAASPSRGISSG